MEKTSGIVEEQRVLPNPDNVVCKQLTPPEISLYWDEVQTAVMAGMTDFPRGFDDAKVATNIMAAISAGQLQAWGLFTKHNNNAAYIGAVTTRIVDDPLLGDREFLICTAYSSGGMSLKAWEKVFGTLEKFAKAEGCHRILGVTKNPRIRDISKHMGFDEDFKVVHKEIP